MRSCLLTVVCLSLCRRCTCTRRRCRPSSTRSQARRPTTSTCGRPPRRPTVSSARGCCGAWRDRGYGVRSAASSATRSARTSSTPTVCRVSIQVGAGGRQWMKGSRSKDEKELSLLAKFFYSFWVISNPRVLVRIDFYICLFSYKKTFYSDMHC